MTRDEFEKSGKEMIKTKNVPLSEAACSAVIEGETVDCSTNVVKVSYDVYRLEYLLTVKNSHL